MQVLCDSNVLLHSLKPDDPHHPAAKQSIQDLKSGGHKLVILPQCLYEFYVVATRPAKNNGTGHESCFSRQSYSSDFVHLETAQTTKPRQADCNVRAVLTLKSTVTPGLDLFGR